MLTSIAMGGIVGEYGLDEGFAMIRQSGFDAIDLDLTYMLPMRPWNVLIPREDNQWENMDDEALRQSVKKYRDAAQRHGLVIGQAHAVYHGTFDKEEFHARHAEMLKRQIMLCAYLDCPRLVIHPEYRPYERRMSETESWEANMRLCKQLIEPLKKHHVTLCLENIYQSYRWANYVGACSDAEEVNRYIDTLNELAGEKCFAFCLDTGHALLSGIDVKEFIHKVGHRLEALHMNDNTCFDDDHMLPYMGKLMWNRLYEGLRDVQYRHTLNFELNFVPIDRELYPEALRFVASAGRLFARRIEEG